MCAAVFCQSMYGVFVAVRNSSEKRGWCVVPGRCVVDAWFVIQLLRQHRRMSMYRANPTVKIPQIITAVAQRPAAVLVAT
jgi:hypothetical protein